MPGVSETVARVIVAEIGVDMSRFPSAGHLVSWAGLCPRLDESAGKRRSTRIRHANPWLKTALIQAAWAAARKNGSYLQSQFRRLKGRRGPKKAIVAVAASMLTAAYFMLRDEKDYHELGGRYLDDVSTRHRGHPEAPPASARPRRGGRSEGRLSQHPHHEFLVSGRRRASRARSAHWSAFCTGAGVAPRAISSDQLDQLPPPPIGPEPSTTSDRGSRGPPGSTTAVTRGVPPARPALSPLRLRVMPLRP